MKNIVTLLIGLTLTTCITGQKSEPELNGKDLKLKYELNNKQSLFPSDNIDFYFGYLIIDVPDSVTYVDIAESIKIIGLKENLISAKIFTSKTGYLMEIDSINRNYSEYFDSYLGYYDLTTKGTKWKYLFDLKDIQFKENLPIKIKIK
ncbi:MAG: hypothetical protein R6W68_14820, partial [Ignavibacteriaceae bacterium]